MNSPSASSRKALSKIACNRLQKELVEWQVNPPAGFKHKVTDSLQSWVIEVNGAQGTLYSGETYQLQVDFPEHYPMEAPQVIFVPPAPLHPHIYSNGHICLDILYDSWSPAMTVSSICISIVSMLSSSTVKQHPADDDRYVKNCKNGRSPKETRWWFHDDKFVLDCPHGGGLRCLSAGEIIMRAVHVDGAGIAYRDGAVSERNASPGAEPEGAMHKDVNGVALSEEEVAPEARSEIRMKDNVEKSANVEENDVNSRFKLRNGREVFEERAYLVGVTRNGDEANGFGIEQSLSELEQLADTAGLVVVGSTYQKLATPNPRTYIGSGKVSEIKSAIHAFDVETVIFDDELSAGQLRNLEKAFGGDVRVCDRTALILDIFNQRAATREAALQVSLAQMEYQLPRLTRMWTHLERQSGGQVKGMGEKQIEVDKRILRDQIAALKKEIESIRKHRKQYRTRRVAVPVPVVSLVGYTNAGKSTLLNQLTGANVLAEDKLFATLDPTTRRVQMKSGSEFLLTDTVGFIQKLPTTLIAAFRATLEEISESSVLVHMVDISHPLAELQIEAVDKVLSELEASSIPKLMVWNKVDNTKDPEKIKLEAKKNADVVCISALTGEGLDDFCDAVQEKLKDTMVWVEALIPFDKGELLSTIHKVGMVEKTEYVENGALIRAHVPLRFARLLTPMRQTCVS